MELSHPSTSNSWQAKLVIGISKKLRSDKTYSEEAVQKVRKRETAKLRKKNPNQGRNASAWPVNELGEQEHAVFSRDETRVTPKSKDHGDMMHRLAHHDSFDSLLDKPHMLDQLRSPYFLSQTNRMPRAEISEKHEICVASLPSELWQRIALFLTPMEAANLAMSNKTLYQKLGSTPFVELDKFANRHYKISFLQKFEPELPGQLLCFPCAKYHLRTQLAKEVLKAEYVKHPVFACPRVTTSVLPRLRLAHCRELPYAFVQLALRHAKYSPSYGVNHEDLARRWTCKHSGWRHRTRYTVHDGRLLMRVVSQSFVPPATVLTETAVRHVLYDRQEYMPFFSVCAHWRDGDLMRVCKCMMSHVPAPPDPYYKQLQRGFLLSRAAARPNFIVRGCDYCAPARRCPECPTEYLTEIQLMEDIDDKVMCFKHALVVTRWSDLGNGCSPYTSPEWAAINGIETGSASGYDSFTNVGRRAVGGVFESQVSGAIPGQRLVSLNPKRKKLGTSIW